MHKCKKLLNKLSKTLK